MAFLAAFELASTATEQVPTIHSIYTYGQPRVGNPDFVNAFQALMVMKIITICHLFHVRSFLFA